MQVSQLLLPCAFYVHVCPCSYVEAEWKRVKNKMCKSQDKMHCFRQAREDKKNRKGEILLHKMCSNY